MVYGEIEKFTTATQVVVFLCILIRSKTMKNIKQQITTSSKSDKKFLFDMYQYIAPVVLTPLSFFLWNKTYSGNLYLVLIAICIPIFYAYIVPGIGTNVLKLWKFDSPLMVGNFRIHHGFIFGSATSVITWIVSNSIANDYKDVLISSFVVGSILAFWNTVYDIEAVKAGVVKVFNQPYSEGKDPDTIVMDYGPIIFGFFGAVYAACLKTSELFIQRYSVTLFQFFFLFAGILLLSIAVPVLSFIRSSKKKHGHNGLRPFYKNQDEGN